MKKIFGIAVVLAFFLCGCSREIPLHQSVESISKIELVNKHCEPSLCTLTSEEAALFLEDLLELECHKHLQPIGDIGYLQVHIYYENGDVDFIGCVANGYVQSGQRIVSGWYYYEETALLELISAHWVQ